ncbi:TRAP transporter substrate-binding protein DctP [Sansalvadorimonas sp. 2012CJ34-2]|uniref:TRAP transporter substrate-binding protein DctP n=1 Tax=Parendozoicomonas callyspongiae TaxID=2942213 RepID=A0ABT0PE33_9GAMM|nr:TRAP transporter substrate-binding protein DctP [Sansalvadorimonas sp. 2012CJ34-2]MCL6269624.1 TRAP transporter substrate-binding protein DctP [Sansalvadorimonas sp. 2012CJ34-2]
MKSLKTFMAIALTVPLLFACSSENSEPATDQVYTIKVTHEEYADTVPDLYAKELARRVEEKSNGRIKFEIFQVGQLGVGVDLIEHLLTGATQMAIVSPGNVATIVPEGQIFALHYLLPTDVKQAYDFLAESQVAKKDLPAIYAEKNLKLMDLWPLGGSNWLTKKNIQSPADYKGMPFRTMDTPLIIKNYEAYGANPTPVPYTDVYSGLQLNMISGVENPLGALVDMKWYEVQDYLVMSNHIMYLEGVFLNDKYFNALPADLQAIMSETIDEMHGYAYELQEKANNDAAKVLADNLEVIELSDPQLAEFKEAALPVRDYFKNNAGERPAQILEKLEDEIKEFEKRQG